jgi:hypothetical protein
MIRFQSMPTALRFVVWLLLTVPVMFAVGALGHLLPPSGVKFYLGISLQIACNLLIGWLFGLIRFRDGPEIGTSILAIIFAFLMPAILVVLAIISTLFCGIDACGH